MTTVQDPTTQGLLSRPLYVYDLPRELLATLSFKGQSQIAETQNPAQTVEGQKETDEIHTTVTGTSCSLCKVSHLSVQEQRDHARSDHHRYNAKAQLRGNPTLNEAQFIKAAEELEESISGSGSSESDGEDNRSADVTLTALLKKQAKISSVDEDQETAPKYSPGKHPLLWFSSSLFPLNITLGFYRALFSDAEQEEPKWLVDSIRKKQLQAIYAQRSGAPTPRELPPSNSSPHIFLCMIGGGHFAAMLVSLVPEIHRIQGNMEERRTRVIAHKTFHRYTTRRKQGGTQSTSDASRGAAHSAGSSLRRYNEAALEKEVRELLADWKQMIDSAQLLFVRANGNTNRRIIFGQYEGQPLKQNDSRLRGFPFSTRRATQGELMRCFKEITRVKVSKIDEAALATTAPKQQEDSRIPVIPKPQPRKPKISKEEEAALLHTSQVQALIRRSKIPVLLSYISSNAIPSSFTFVPSDTPQNFRCPTPLHMAANLNLSPVVTALLVKAGADPTIRNSEGKTAFDLAGDRNTRDAFRAARYELGESKWDWYSSKVPPAISKADIDSRIEGERKAAEEEETNRRKAEIERLRKEDAERAANRREPKRAGGTKLAAVEKTAADRREEEMRGMTPEMRMRLERERRARAAEERIRRMQER